MFELTPKPNLPAVWVEGGDGEHVTLSISTKTEKSGDASTAHSVDN